MSTTKTATRPRVGYRLRKRTLPEAPARVARFIRTHPAATHPEIVRATRLNPNTVNGSIHTLKTLGMLEVVPVDVHAS